MAAFVHVIKQYCLLMLIYSRHLTQPNFRACIWSFPLPSNASVCIRVYIPGHVYTDPRLFLENEKNGHFLS